MPGRFWKEAFCVVVMSIHLSSLALAFGDVDMTFTHQASQPGLTLSSKNFGNEVLYQVFVDRFANGNSQNDCLFNSRFCSPDHSDWYRTWGGDLRGIIQHMPYLKSLGVTRLWLTPIFENQNVTVRKERHNVNAEVTNYHGYWFKDLFHVSPTFADHGVEDYETVGEMIQSGLPQIRILLDTAVNHTSPSDASADTLALATDLQPIPQNSPYPKTQRGALFKAGRYYSGLDEDNWRIAHEPGYVPAFHHFGSITDWDNPFQVENYMLDGLSDLSQDDPAIAQYMIDAHNFWLDRFPDLGGYRMDTIKHVAQGFWQNFSQNIYQRHPRTQIVGEFFGAGPFNAASHPFYRDTKMSLFDFDFRSVIESIFTQGGSFERLADLWSRDEQLVDARELVTFIDNHDLPRIRAHGMSLAGMKQAMTLQFASRGVPCMFYGQEQDLFVSGDPGDPYNRPMMQSFDEQSDMFQFVQRLVSFRKANESTRYGLTHIVHLTANIIGFERINSEDSIFFATSKNPRVGADEFEMVGLRMEDGVYEDVLNGSLYSIENGRIHVSLRNGGMILLSSRNKRAVAF